VCNFQSERLLQIKREYNVKINQQRRTTLQILNKEAFSVVKKKLTHYALKLSIIEWSTIKRIADDIEEGKEEEVEFDRNVGCTLSCKLLARYSLPCRH
jgi:hypothetical protein